MNKLRIGAAIATATALLIGSMSYANAQSSSKWTGCHVGGSIAAVSVNNRFSGSGFGVDTGAQGGGLGVGVGCDMALPDSSIVLGLFGDFLWMNADSRANLYHYSAKLDYNHQWTVGGRAGTLLTPDVLAYALVGYTELDTSNLRFGYHNISVGTFSGYTVGGGLETAFGENMLVGLEYRYSDLDSVRKYGINIDPDTQVVKLNVKWKLWGATEELIPLK